MDNSNFWENIFSNKEWGKYPSENLIRFIARNFYNVQDRSKINILELGLGTGANLWFCAREGFSVSGIEWSKTGVERFKKRLEDENLSKQIKEIKIGDYAQKLDEFENESFDAIIDVASLCCNDFEKTKSIFDKAILKLKPCGKFLSMTLATGLFGYEKEKGLEQTPEYGIYKGNGKLRFSTLNEIKSLYKHKDFKRTNLSMLTLEDVLEDKETRVIDKIFIIEGEKCTNWGGGFRSSKEEWKMSKISLEAYLASNFNTLSFKDDIYFSFDYAKLYGDVFEFEYKKDGFVFKTLGVKQEILNSGFFDLQSPYGYNGIYTNTKDEDFLNEAFENLKQKALKEKIIAFFIRFHPFDDHINAYKNNLNFINKNKKIIIVPTEQDITLIRKNYNPRIKAYVKKARENLKIDFIKIDENKDFKILYEKTMQRNDAENFYFFDKKYFNKLYNFKEYIVLKASLNEEVLAFASFFLCKDFSYYHLSANSLKANANAALLDFFFEYANKKGSKFCILGGGVKDDDTLFNYKQKFSIVDSYFYIGGIIFNVPQYEYFCQNSKSEKFLKYRFINDSPPPLTHLSYDYIF